MRRAGHMTPPSPEVPGNLVSFFCGLSGGGQMYPPKVRVELSSANKIKITTNKVKFLTICFRGYLVFTFCLLFPRTPCVACAQCTTSRNVFLVVLVFYS